MKQRSKDFKDSFYIIFAFLSLASVSYFYIGKKTGNKDWINTGFLYLLALFIPGVNIVAYFLGIANILKTRKEYLVRRNIKSLLASDPELTEIANIWKAREEYLIRSEMDSSLRLEDREDREIKQKLSIEYGLADAKSDPEILQEDQFFSEKLPDNEYLQKLHEFRWKILNTKVRERMEEIEFICKKIFDYVEKHPEATYKTRTLVNYYLPELFTQMEKYIELQQNADLSSQNVQISMNKIAGLLPIIKNACSKIYDQLFDDSLLDISNDIEVLKNHLAQNGLTANNKDPF